MAPDPIAGSDYPRVNERAFTLTEMIVVIGIIVLLIGIAIPAIRALTGDRNVGAAYNVVAAIIGQARQDAMAQSNTYPYHGAMFFLNPATDRVTALFVEGEYPVNASVAPGAQVWIDETPGREQIALPAGVGLQTIANPSTAQPDRYLGFNPSSGSMAMGNVTVAPKFGGLILFDSNGRLVSVTYCLLCSGPPDLFGGTTTLPVPNSTTFSGFNTSTGYPQSQFGFVLFDRDSYLGQGNVDGSYGLDSTVNTTMQTNQDNWLDTNSTPVLINRYNGTLIKGE
ncbi:MAG TPA: prepilin-type N-terminal cleavage/methylation domain-containing protein [Tepidisphaeraceae bacterium]|nr:prepilin-type N-terminal cleavage/methylation domain-containing protein [Tepidisphaeraceae bacterium]